MTSKAEVKAVLAEMLIRYPRQEIPAPTLDAYAVDLADIPVDELRQVCRHLWLTEEWWPSVSRIRTVWGELGTPDNADADLRWVERRMSRLAPGEQPNPYSSMVREPAADEYPNAVCREAVAIFGWRRLYDTDSGRLAGEWAKSYRQARQNVIDRRVAAPAIAMADALPQPDELRPALKAVS